jgi:uncharacterized membrane protein
LIKNFAIYLSFLIALIAIDLVWLLGIAKNLYRNEMGDLMASEPKLLAGLAFYLIYALGVCIFVIVPALSKQSWIYALQYGALFGLFCYMTYDLTNLATLRGWSVAVTALDLVWGAFVTGVAAAVASAGTSWLSRG